MTAGRWILGAVVAGAAAAIASATPAIADPDNLVPWCSGDQTPMDANCKVAPSQVFTHDHGVGANPQLPLGVDPGQEPAVETGGIE